jgi:hypothetical protein
MPYSFDLDFIKPEEEGIPSPPRVAIFIKSCSVDDTGRRFITPRDCLSMEEFDGQIDRLKRELEEIRKKAKKKFSKK